MRSTAVVLSTVLFSLLAWSAPALAQVTLEVDITGGVPGSYSSINAAIDDANNLDTILVYSGNYVEDVNFDGKDVSVSAVAGPTVTTIVGAGNAVYFGNNEGAAAQLTGFTIHSSGHGIHVTAGASPTITGCVIEDLTGGYPIYLYNAGSPLIQDTTVQNNEYYHGVYSWYSSPTFTGCTFTGQICWNYGTVYSDDGSDVTIDSSTFTNNDGGSNGGGVYVESSTATITNSTFTGNVASYGGAVDAYYGNLVFRGNTVFDNTATTDGGGVSLVGSPALIEGNDIIENEAATNGGGIRLNSPSRVAVFNNNLLGNLAGNQGGGMYLAGSTTALVTGNIIAGGNNGEGVYAVPSTGNRHHFTANTFWDNYDGDWGGDPDSPIGTWGNTAEDPLFVAYSADGDLTNDDLALQSGSPCIDTGPPGMLDPSGGAADRGNGGADYDVDLSGLGDKIVSSYWPGAYTSINAAIDDAGNGETIVLYPGLYYEDVDYDGKNITVVSGLGREVTAITGGGTAVYFGSGEAATAQLTDVILRSEGTHRL